ncbi:MAG: serine/threonine-protein kinase [Kofleriaceae bacterium]|nr:serine/threonine-protein kinase [Kofleriaceae bacterium]
MSDRAGAPCLDEESVLRYLDGQTDEASDAHLADCASCRSLVRLAAATSPRAVDTEQAATRIRPSVLGVRSSRDVLSPGDRLGRYEIVAPLGQGGMGLVYEAFDPELQRHVAIKLLHASRDPRMHAQLVREARAIARLAHPHVVAVHDVGEDGGRSFVAMELVRGGTLDDWRRARPRSTREVLAMFAAAGAGLAAAHAAGLVHRDIKPANVLVGEDGRPRISDFGLAIPDAPDDPHAPVEAQAGTPAYMAPEQHDGGEVDARADQFSFAVALYEALAERRPFGGTSRREIREAIAAGPPRLPARVPRRVSAAIHRALREAPASRFPSMSPLLAALAPPRRRLGLIAAGSAAAIAAVAIAGATRAGAAKPCLQLERPLTAVWGPAQRAKLERAFTTAGAPAETSAAVAGALDRWAETWNATAIDACQAAQVRREQTPAQQELRTICLDERLGELRAVTDLLVAADRAIVASAHAMTSSLVSPAVCNELSTLGAKAPLVRGSAQEHAVTALRPRLASVRATLAAGDAAKAYAQLVPLREEIGRTAYRPLEAEAALLAGRVAQARGRFAEAETELEAAVLAAEAGRDDQAAAAAWIALAHVRARGRGDLRRATEALAHADATVERLGDDLEALAALAYARGSTLRQSGDYPGARAALAEAVRRYERARVDRTLELTQAQLDLAGVLGALGDRQATATAEEALARRRAAFGPAHPELAAGLVVAASIADLELDPTRATRYLDEADAIYARTLDATHPRRAQALQIRSSTLISAGRPSDALAPATAARDLLAQHQGEDFPEVATLDVWIAFARFHAGDHLGARADLERALALLQRTKGPGALEAINARVLRVLVAHAAGEQAAAEREARQVVEEGTRALGDNHPLMAKAWRALAIVMTDRAPGEALAAYRRVLAIREQLGGPMHRSVAAAAYELGEHLLEHEQFADAAVLLERAVTIEEHHGSAGSETARGARMRWADALRALAQEARGVGVLQALVTELEQATPPDDLRLHQARLMLGIDLAATGGDRARARALVRAARAALRGRDPDSVRIADAWLRRHR